jgi:hypothetical protein
VRIGVAARSVERRRNSGAVSTGSEQTVKQDAGFERVEKPGANKAPVKQVPLAAWEGVGSPQSRPCASAGGDHHRHACGDLREKRYEILGYVADTERGNHQSIAPVSGGLDEGTVVAKGDGDQANPSIWEPER